jgi:pimeloyl-ACP methyl ester carboxylesterase
MVSYHSQDAWQQIIRNWAGAWLDLAKLQGDLSGGRLGEIICPMLVMFGGQDEHMPVSEMEELTQCVPNARLSLYPDAGHCVHDGRSTREASTREAREFLLTSF